MFDEQLKNDIAAEGATLATAVNNLMKTKYERTLEDMAKRHDEQNEPLVNVPTSPFAIRYVFNENGGFDAVATTVLVSDKTINTYLRPQPADAPGYPLGAKYTQPFYVEENSAVVLAKGDFYKAPSYPIPGATITVNGKSYVAIILGLFGRLWKLLPN